MKFISTLLLITFLLLNLGCSKEDWPRVRYRVVTKSSAVISYTMTSNKIKSEEVSGDWSVSFRGKKGSPIFLSATKTGAFGDTKIIVYINGNAAFSQSTNQPGETIYIETTIP